MRGWDKDDYDKALRLWKDGFSASAISRILCGRKSRNAVIGVIYRAGLSGSRSSHVRKLKKSAPRPVRVQRRSPPKAPREHGASVAAWREPRQPLPPDSTSAPDGGVQFKHLENHHCRWPYGDPGEAGFHFCGAERVPGISWCQDHALRAFASPKLPEKSEKEWRRLDITVPVVADTKKEMA